jgi:hypothetical protein
LHRRAASDLNLVCSECSRPVVTVFGLPHLSDREFIDGVWRCVHCNALIEA